METKVNYVLCGGTYLYTVLAAIKKIAKRRGQNNNGIKETTCFLDLIKIPKLESGYQLDEGDISSVISKYKNCTLEAPDWLLIRNRNYIECFDKLVKENYQEVLHSMIVWADKYLDLQKNGDWLCHALLELIYYDKDINNATEIYAKVDGEPISISDLKEMKEIHVQAFLLGVWHYVVVARINNKNGLLTLNQITDTSGLKKSVRKLQDFYGTKLETKFTVRILKLEKVVPQTGESYPLFDFFDDADSEGDNDSREILPGKSELIGLSDNEIALSDFKYTSYMESQYSAYEKVKTLLFHNEPRDFKSIYLCNDIERPYSMNRFLYMPREEMESEYFQIGHTGAIHNFTYEDMEEYNIKYLIVTGTGGLGKSMMMRHLLLDAIENYDDYRVIPLFIPLKDYKQPDTSLIDFFYEVFDSYADGISKDCFIDLLKSGKMLLLLDGLDEVKDQLRMEFDVAFEKFVNRYRNNYYVMSSRPKSKFIGFSRFTRTNLLPFTKKQSIELIKKLDLGKTDEKIKEGFLQELDNNLYSSHKEFAENPLLLTIMLLTYKQKTNIPNEMHKFYEKAYETLFSEHDNIKVGYEREHKTALKQDEFADYFAEFCFLSYQEDNIDPSEDDCRRFFDEMDINEKDRDCFGCKDLLDDLVDCVCLMYEEGQKYHFIHRSIQEYFCARYFCKLPDSLLPEIGDFFENRETKNGDKTFDMLYAMKSSSVEEMIFLPRLSKLFELEEGKIIPSYEKFLREMYPTLNFEVGRTLGLDEVEAVSYLYRFIADKQGYLSCALDFDFPSLDYYDEFIVAEYVEYEDDYEVYCDDGMKQVFRGCNSVLVNKEDVPDDYLLHFDMPDTVGFSYEILMEDIFNQEYDYAEIIEFLYSDKCPLKNEFDQMYAYYKELLLKKQNKKESLHTRLKRKKHSL